MVNQDSSCTTTHVLITPSSPTPPHLRNLQLSFLDQLCPPIYIHIILYFQQPPLLQVTQCLKQSLSEALATYYPLAGRLRDGSWIDCNDAGAEYMEAHFQDARILDVIENSDPDELKKYVPAAPGFGTDIPLAVQVSSFACGGVAIGICVAHRVVDATSMVMFINTWAVACRGDSKAVATAAQPGGFGCASRFPAADFSKFYPPQPPLQPIVKVVTKRFLFNEWKVSFLRKAAAGTMMVNPTRVEAVSAFIWRHFIEAVTSRGNGGNENRVFAATHAVDIRQRANPSLPHPYFGNACARAMAMVEAPEIEPENYYNLALKLRNAISKADSSYVKRLENGDEFLKYYSRNEENDPVFKNGTKTLEICSFTSWYRLSAYEADYGWGKPVWVSIISVPLKNLIFFLGTKSGDGIEAWVNMSEEDIAEIERNYNLLQQVEDAMEPPTKSKYENVGI